MSASAPSIVAPGNSIGTLTVAGNINFADTTYQVEANAAGAADLILAGGVATATGGTVSVIASPGQYSHLTTYQILSASGSVSGTFANLDVNLPGLTASLVYGPTSVDLVLTVSNIDFGPFAHTPNQIATAAAIQSGGSAGAIYNDFLNQLPATGYLTAAFDSVR